MDGIGCGSSTVRSHVRFGSRARSAPRPSEPLHSSGGQSPWSPGGMTHGGYGHGDQGYRGKPYKKRKSWLEDIFD